MKEDTKTFMLGVFSSMLAGFILYKIMTSKEKSNYDSKSSSQIKEERSLL